ncbi:MAG TPA: hypothetical protein VK171_05465 [Fimbriimonas sp.]|nr:hypothetical protein [Fimbriimonas sp.]
MVSQERGTRVITASCEPRPSTAKVISWDEYEAQNPIALPSNKLKAEIVFNEWFDKAAEIGRSYLLKVEYDQKSLGAYVNEVDHEIDGVRYILSYKPHCSSEPDKPVFSLEVLIRTHDQYEKHLRLTWNLLALREQHQCHVGASCGRNEVSGICTTVLDFTGDTKTIFDRLVLLSSLMKLEVSL